MNKIKTIKELKEKAVQLQSSHQKYEGRILICMTGCRALGAADVSKAFKDKLAEAKLDKKFEIVETGCIGLCAKAPVVLIEPYDYLYGGVKPDNVDEIITETIINGKTVDSLLAKDDDGKSIKNINDINFYKNQKRVVLEKCGRIDPTKIEDALATGGYLAVAKALGDLTSEQIIEEVIAAGLRGRGGGGFSAGLKWKFCRQAKGDEKYIICNADEGDPGAFMDRALLEGDPHKVIEAMIIAAKAIGANHGFIYVRAEYPIAVEHINIALKQATDSGLLGKDILGTGFDFDIEVRMGAGAFVCGEETALIESLEGKRGMPRPRPPFPANKGYKGKPTNINNVETFCNIAAIINNGAKWYSSIGTNNNSGTKIFALAGTVENTGLVEVPMGTTLRQIVFDIGGGIPNGKKFKAAQIGGPSGGCIPEQHLDCEIDYDSLQKIGAIMGSGGLIVMDENNCMVDVARYFLEFVQAESCGKCTPCRVGTKEMLEILERICAGKADIEELDRLEELALYVKKASLCGLGQTAPNPVLSTMSHFREEYEQHINDKKCQAAVCTNLLSYEILDTCVGCGACIKVCPIDAIEGVKKEQHTIIEDKCIRCGQCYNACKFDAIEKK